MKSVIMLLWFMWITQIIIFLLQDYRIVEAVNRFINYINEKERRNNITNFEYEERYGERPMSDIESEIAQKEIDDRERLETLEKFLDNIKEILKQNWTSKDKISEIEEEIKSID